MKKLATVMIALFSVVSFANGQMKPEAGDMGLGFEVTGLANVGFWNRDNSGLSGMTHPGIGTIDNLVPQQLLFGRYYLSSDLALRVSFGINSTSNKTNSVDSVWAPVTFEGGLGTGTSKTSAFSLGIGAGLEKHFATSASRLDPYAGIMANVAMLGSVKMDSTYEEAFATATNNNTQHSTSDYQGGMSWGLNLLGGFNYFFSDNVAIGAEIGWGMMGASTGGTWNTTSESSTGGTANPTTKTTGEYKMSTGGLRVMSTGGVHFSIFW